MARNKLEQVRAWIWSDSWRQVYARVYDRVGRSVGGQVENQVWLQVNDQVSRPIGDAVFYEGVVLVNRQLRSEVNPGSQPGQSSVSSQPE